MGLLMGMKHLTIISLKILSVKLLILLVDLYSGLPSGRNLISTLARETESCRSDSTGRCYVAQQASPWSLIESSTNGDYAERDRYWFVINCL